MRNLLHGLLIAAFSLVACSAEKGHPPSPDLIVTNADIVTNDLTTPQAQAFAVLNGKFIAIGNNDGIQAMAGKDTMIIDAAGVTVVPGLIDGHTHLIGGSGLAVGVDLSEIEDKSEWLRIIRDKALSLPEGAWILGGAWDHNLSDGVLPTKEMLDSVAPDHPILLRDIDGHSAWANSLAIEIAGIGAESTVPQGGKILVDPQSGEPTGIFLEGAARLFGDAPGMREASDPVAGLKAAIALANSLGITGAHDMSGNLDAFLSVLDDGDLTMRIWQGGFARGATPAEAFGQLTAERDRVRQAVAANPQTSTMGPMLEIGYTKMMVDGVLSTRTALMKEPYSDDPGAEAVPFVSFEELSSMIAAAHAAGFPVAVHAIGDEGVSWVLDAFAASPRPPGHTDGSR